ncbi:MAG: AbiV family abortive infection protein [Candidatus Paceibacterota bacterium]
MEEEIIRGLPKIIDNSKSLLSDANFLCENNRKERAYSIFQLATEEIAKAFYLVGGVIFGFEEDRKKMLCKIRDHKFKSKKAIGLEYIVIQLLKDISYEKYELSVRNSILEFNSINELNNKKNHGFYTSFINTENTFKTPSELISNEDVEDIKTKATFRVWIGSKLLIPMIENIDSIKEKVNEINFDNKEIDGDHITELKGIIDKYNL